MWSWFSPNRRKRPQQRSSRPQAFTDQHRLRLRRATLEAPELTKPVLIGPHARGPLEA